MIQQNTRAHRHSKETKYAVGIWDSDSINACKLCQSEFTLLNRRHHCRACGKLICGGCSKSKTLKYVSIGESLFDGEKRKEKRVCTPCYDLYETERILDVAAKKQAQEAKEREERHARKASRDAEAITEAAAKEAAKIAECHHHHHHEEEEHEAEKEFTEADLRTLLAGGEPAWLDRIVPHILEQQKQATARPFLRPHFEELVSKATQTCNDSTLAGPSVKRINQIVSEYSQDDWEGLRKLRDGNELAELLEKL
jgi:hypothetical protein